MDETTFNTAADATLAQLETVLDAFSGDFDVELKAGGVMALEFDDGHKIIINRHSAAREIWVADKSGGFHFRPENGRWVGTRDGEDLYRVLSRLISQYTDTPVTLSAPQAG